MGRVPPPEERKHEIHANAFPENIDYSDTGCHIHPRCLSCPLPVCALDTREEHQMNRAERNAKIVEMWQRGTPVTEIASVLNMTRQAIYIMLKRSGYTIRGKQKNPRAKATTESR